MNKKLLFLFIATIFYCCSSVRNKTELIAYINDSDNGLIKQAEYNGINLCMVYRPSDLLVLQDMENEKKIEKAVVENVKQRYNNYMYFTLSMSYKDESDVLYGGGVSAEAFSSKLQNIHFRMQDFVYLLSENDTIYLADYYVPQTYGLNKSTQILLAFPKKNISENFTIKLKDPGIGYGLQSFDFESEKLFNVPCIDVYKELELARL